MKKVKIFLCFIVLIILATLGLKSSNLRKKVAKAKAENEKLKHDSKIKETKDVVNSISKQNDILKKDKDKHKLSIEVLDEELIQLDKKIKKSEEKSKKAESDIETIADALAYAEKLKRGEI